MLRNVINCNNKYAISQSLYFAFNLNKIQLKYRKQDIEHTSKAIQLWNKASNLDKSKNAKICSAASWSQSADCGRKRKSPQKWITSHQMLKKEAWSGLSMVQTGRRKKLLFCFLWYVDVNICSIVNEIQYDVIVIII